MTENWLPAIQLPSPKGEFIEEILIEYQNDLGTFHAIGLFTTASDDGSPVFLEVLTGTAIDWNKTVKRWRWFNTAPPSQ